MNPEENLTKSKIFVNVPGGGSGHFLCLLLLGLARGHVQLTESHRAHKDLDKYTQYHNWQTSWHDNKLSRYINGSQDTPIIEAIEYIQKTYHFYTTPDPFYIGQIHAINPDPIMLAFNNTKLIHVTISEDDKDQLAYNWVTKSYFLHQQWGVLRAGLKHVQTRYNKLLDMDPRLVNDQTDVKLLTYIQRYFTEYGLQKYQKVRLSENYPTFEIKFSDIRTKKLINSIDSLIEFLGITVSLEQKSNAIQMINTYTDAQIIVPWKLTINDYT